MAYPDPHWLLTFGGSLPGGEQWTCTARLAGVHVTTSALGQAACDAYASAIDGWWTDAVMISHMVKLGTVKLNWVDTAGHYIDTWTNRTDFDPEHANSGGMWEQHPNQIAWVVSLGTAATRGHAHAGRMFLPIPAPKLEANGTVSTTDTGIGLLSAKDLINAINGVTEVSAHVCIMSKIGSGTANAVTKVGLGRALDTMRSRRRSVPEGTTWEALV
jgi:hypothetical protein